ncbi:MAG: hypothetical protein LBK63_14320 [Treponema sp.]|nr:hypothetical protein [Treponema sp.]
MAVVLIEGDNGTGKTTISQKFSENGFYVVTDESAIKELEKQAKNFTVGSKERIDAFIAYNIYCGNEALKYRNSLIVRYWISTISAAYADGLFSLKEAIQKTKILSQVLPQPDFIFRLKCDYDVRVKRIATRNLKTYDTSDNITFERDKKYQEILSKIEKYLKNWHNINTVDKNPEQIFTFMMSVIKSPKTKASYEKNV